MMSYLTKLCAATVIYLIFLFSAQQNGTIVNIKNDNPLDRAVDYPTANSIGIEAGQHDLARVEDDVFNERL